MEHMNSGVDMDITVTSLKVAFRKLADITHEEPRGLILSLEATQDIGEIIASNTEFNGLRIDVVRNLPADMWILYNHIDAVYSNGA